MAYYTATGNPGTQTSGRSATTREEFLLIQTGFGQASNDIQALAAAVGIGVTTTENDIASATTTDIGNGLGNVLRITGTNAINSFGANYTGAKQLRFSGILTLLNNPALLLPGGANITTEAGDVCIAVPIGNPATGWRVLAYCRMSKALLDDDAVRKSDAGAQVVAGTLQSAGFIGNLQGNVSGTATNVTGTVGIANGGTGATTAATARGALAAAKSGDNSDITSLSALTSINGGSIGGTRNKLINGNFGINQRGYVSGAATTAGQYTLDRWKVTGTGGITFSTVSNVTTVTIPSGQALQQVIEGVNLQSGSHVLSWAGTAQGRIDGGSYGASGAVTATATGGTNMTVEFGPGTVSLAQLEEGSLASRFEQRLITIELALCQRYYERISGAGGANSIYVVAYAVGGNGFTQTITWKVSKRTNPTLSKGGTWSVTNTSQPTVSGTGTDSCFVQGVATATGQAFFGTVDSTTYIDASAEL